MVPPLEDGTRIRCLRPRPMVSPAFTAVCAVVCAVPLLVAGAVAHDVRPSIPDGQAGGTSSQLTAVAGTSGLDGTVATPPGTPAQQFNEPPGPLPTAQPTPQPTVGRSFQPTFETTVLPTIWPGIPPGNRPPAELAEGRILRSADFDVSCHSGAASLFPFGLGSGSQPQHWCRFAVLDPVPGAHYEFIVDGRTYSGHTVDVPATGAVMSVELQASKGEQSAAATRTFRPEELATEPPPSGSPPPSSAPGTPSEGVAGPTETDGPLAKCELGHIAFTADTSLNLGETGLVSIRVLHSGSPADPTEGLPGTAEPETDETLVCETMRAELVGPGVGIERQGGGDGIQRVPETTYGQWTWEVTAREEGVHELTVILYAVDSRNHASLAATDRISVTVNVGFVQRVGTVVREWASPLGLTIPILLAGATAVYVWIRKGGYKPKHAASEP